MHLELLHLVHFKNYLNAHVKFGPALNCILGSNGSGKTNLLDAIHYISFTKSALQSTDRLLLFEQKEYLHLQAKLRNEENEIIVKCGYQPGKPKVISWNEEKYEKLSAHIGKIPLVLIAPGDTDLIHGIHELRRKFFDRTISQFNLNYLETLIQYQHQLKQRNALLKQIFEGATYDQQLLQAYTPKLTELGQIIYQERAQFLSKFKPIFQEFYRQIVQKEELVDIFYESDLQDDSWASNFGNQIRQEIIAQKTLSGPHKDKFTFMLNGQDVKKFGSQGQQKSLLIALKLAQFEFLKQQKSMKPLLLLDDIFDKLDDQRIKHLLNLVKEDYFGQVFITDARAERTKILLNNLDLPFHEILVDNGEIKQIKDATD